MKGRLIWNFDKLFYSPSDNAKITLWFENYGETFIYISQVQVKFEFGVYVLPPTICGAIGPSECYCLGSIPLMLPQDIVGAQPFQISFTLYELINRNWVLRPTHPTPEYVINVFSTPVYRIFLSRGLRPEDMAVGNVIERMLREWGCDPVTVGINVKVPDSQVASEVLNQIQNSAGLIAIATPRIKEFSTQFRYTLEWLHGEAAMAYAKSKPILILKDKTVRLGGLPSYLSPQLVVEFDPLDLADLQAKLSFIMPRFRAAIEQKNTVTFNQNIQDLVEKGLAVVGAGVIGAAIGYFIDEWFKDDKTRRGSKRRPRS